MKKSFKKLENSIINCKKCPRLVNFRTQVAKDKRKQYINEKYWGKPITGFGDRKARILLVGLAILIYFNSSLFIELLAPNLSSDAKSIATYQLQILTPFIPLSV